MQSLRQIWKDDYNFKTRPHVNLMRFMLSDGSDSNQDGKPKQ
jgi:Cft2 family RNA processing exonuclease